MTDTRPGVSVPPPVSAAQRSVLYAVRRRGQATVADVAEMLDMTVSGARQHLTGLADAGLLEAGEAAASRASRVAASGCYCIAPAAEPLFPRAYGELTNQLLGYVPAGAVTAAFEHRRDDRIEAARARLAAAGELRRQGRRAGEDPRRGRLPGRPPSRSATAATASPSATAPSSPSPASTPRPARPSSSSCAPPSPRPTIERVTHMMAGAHSCSYEVRPPLIIRVFEHVLSVRCADAGAQHSARSVQSTVSRAGSWGPRW